MVWEESGRGSVLKGERELQDLWDYKLRVQEKEESGMPPEQQDGRKSHCWK